ncbi:MAG: TRAP transporter large permease subunit [Pseudomonadota bacterium]
MEWWAWLTVFFAAFIILLLLGVRVAFVFLLISAVGMFIFFNGAPGLRQLIQSLFSSIGAFHLLPLPLFVLMGELLFRGGLADQALDSLDKWLGRVPGRLALLSVAGGALFSVMTGASLATTALLGSTLVPEMEKRGYKKSMTMGPILASGTLAAMIPPTALGVTLAAIAEISVGETLVAIIVPGILMAVLYATYILIRCFLQPSIAPSYEVAWTPIRERLTSVLKHVIPLGFLVFLVIGLIFLGVATPSESAALGAVGSVILLAAKGTLNRKVLSESSRATAVLSGAIFLIIAAATAFSQVLAASGATQGLIRFVAGLQVSPMMAIIFMQVVVLILGCIMEPVSIMLITLPIFMPVVHSLGFDSIWFAVVMLMNIEVATISPPFGLALFVMKGVSPPGTSMGDVYYSALPFIGIILVSMCLVIAFPSLALFLPGFMR